MDTFIDSIKRRLLVKYPFFGSITANLDYIEDSSIETAATDGKNIYYNPEFVKKLSRDEQTFLFAHEVCHVAFDHIYRSEGKDKEIWNIATDAVINDLLRQDGLDIIQGGVDVVGAAKYDAEQMYKKLIKEREGEKNSNSHNDQENNQHNSEDNNQSENQSDSNNKQDSKQNQNGQQNGQNSQRSSQNANSQSNEATNKNQPESNNNNSGNLNNQNSENTNSNNQESDKKGDSSQQQSSSNSDVGHDTHSMWEKAIEGRKTEEKLRQEKKQKGNDNESSNDKGKNSQCKKESIFDKLFKNRKREGNNEGQEKKEQSENGDSQSDCKTPDDIRKKKIEDAVKNISQIGEKKAFSQNKIDRQKQLQELSASLAKQSMGAGSQTNSIDRAVGDIGTSAPLIDWRKLLKEAVNIELDWSYKNASIEEGVITPYLEEIPKPETEIVLDTSGSIDEILLKNFLRECKNILQESKVKVGCFDTKFYGFHEIRNINDIDSMPFKGGGGTDFNAAVNAFSRRVENKIIFTDGDAQMPNNSINAIWIVFGDIKISPRGGKVIYISDEQLRRLCQSYVKDRPASDMNR